MMVSVVCAATITQIRDHAPTKTLERTELVQKLPFTKLEVWLELALIWLQITVDGSVTGGQIWIILKRKML